MKGTITALAAFRELESLADRRAPSIVAIGDLDLWHASCGSVPRYENLHFCALEALSRPVIELCRPELIVSPVVTKRFDCIDVASLLQRIGYKGAYRALARNLPDPAMICREVRLYFPFLDFDICEIQTGVQGRIN